jgi:hypothetical protein
MPTSRITILPAFSTAAWPSRRGGILGRIGWLNACFAASAIGAIAVGRSLENWHPTLRKPSWTCCDTLYAGIAR